jgi:L-lactate dehydrogenase complex protein LldG
VAVIDARTAKVMENVRRALGRDGALVSAPVPPEIDEAITRTAQNGADLSERFGRMCMASKTGFERVEAREIARRVAEFLREQGVKRAALSAGGIIQECGIGDELRRRGFEAVSWDDLTLDQLYDFDCGVTDVHCAVAETGSLVVRPSARQGRGLSLAPRVHVAVVEKGQIVADLVDLFAKLSKEETTGSVSLITGPSKTSDIEMNLVVGVHGPTTVRVMLIE